jgi:hypothetical protein
MAVFAPVKSGVVAVEISMLAPTVMSGSLTASCGPIDKTITLADNRVSELSCTSRTRAR